MNIQVQKSYKVHMNVFRRYISDLKKMGFTIPELPETQIITEENVNSLKNIKTFYRESGRGLDSFYQKTGQSGECRLLLLQTRLVPLMVVEPNAMR